MNNTEFVSALNDYSFNGENDMDMLKDGGGRSS